MSFQDRPSYQRPTISSSSPSVTPAKRTPGSVPLVRGLSPVRSPYYGRAQEVDAQRSHDNPLFRNRVSDAGERRSGRPAVDTSPLRTAKSLKENDEADETWKVHVEKVPFGSKQGSTTPGKTSRLGAMPFTTPPKPVVKRKILAESNRDVTKPLSFSTSRRVEECQIAVASSTLPVEDGARNEAKRRMSESNSNKSDEQQQHSTMASIEELQQRIQKFLNTETRVETPVVPVQRSESGGSPERRSAENGTAAFQPVFISYSPRPEAPRSRARSPSPTPAEAGEEEEEFNNVSVHRLDRSPVRVMEKSTTPSSYDPKTNYLSPRPQFLRYRPQKRLELLRNSAEYLNLDLDSSPTDSSAESANNEVQPDSPTCSIKLESEVKSSFSSEEESGVDSVAKSTKVELDSGGDTSTESRPLESSEVSTLHSLDAGEDIVECHSEEFRMELREEISGVYLPPFHCAGEEIQECDFDCQVKLSEGQSPGNQVNAAESISVSSTLTSEISENHEHAPECDTLQESEGESTQVHPFAADCETVQGPKEELDVEEINSPEFDDEIRSLPGRVFRSFACALLVLGFTLFTLFASGSPGLLPEPLAHNEIAVFWRTSEFTAPVRTFLGSAEGLWKETSGLCAYPVDLRYMETLGTKLQDVRNSMAEFDSSQYANDLISEFYSTSAAYVAPLSEYVTRTYLHVRKWLSDATDSYTSRAPETEEWGWVPEYDFIVVRDVPDWAEVYETILAKVESREVKSVFESHIDSNGAKSVHEFIEESSVDDDSDETDEASISPESELADYASTSPLPVSEPPNNQFTHSDIERDSVGVNEQALLESEDQDHFFGSSAAAVGVAVDDTVVPFPAETSCVEPLTVILSEGGSVADVDSGRVEESEDAAALSWNFVQTGVHGVDPVEETVHAADSVHYLHQQELPQESWSRETENADLRAIEDGVGPDDTISSVHYSHQQELPQESRPSETENVGLRGIEDGLGPHDTISPEFSSRPSMMVADTEAEVSGVSPQPKLGYVMSPAVLTASVASLLVASVIAVILLKPAQKSISRVFRKAKGDAWEKQRKPVDANGVRATKGKLPRKPQRTFKISTNSQMLDSGSNPLHGDYAAEATLPSDYAEQFSTPMLPSEKTYSKPAIDRSAYLSPEKMSKPLTDNYSFLSPEIEVLEDSSLGRFTALVPVVHNEGTEKEQVKLTPVRRSSRIRSRLQSPSHTLSHFSYSP